MIIPVLGIALTVAMGLALVSNGINMKTIYEIEADRYYIAETEKLLADQYAAVEEKLEVARFQNNTMAIAEYETILNSIRLLRNRSNVVAIGRQVEQKKSAFIESQYAIFQADMTIRAVTWGMGKVGFGKVTDSFMLGKNWPPGSNFSTWNPQGGFTERIILGSKPELVAAQFSDELADFFSAILTGFDVARTVSAPEDIRQARDANTFVADELDKMGNMRPLPKDIGDYLASSLVKKIIKENQQMAGESDLTKAIFTRKQACTALRKLWLDEQRDLVRSEAVRMAMNRLECDNLAKPLAQTEEDEAAEEPLETSELEPLPEEIAPSSDILPKNTEPIASDDIPEGTYIGTIEFSEKYSTFAYSITSEVILTVAQDGKVTGSFTGLIIDTPYSYENCSVQWESTFSGDFSGRLTGPEGVIQSSETMDFDPNTDCSDTFETATGSFNRGIEIKISGNTLTGITNPRPDNPDEIFILIFNASKQ